MRYLSGAVKAVAARAELGTVTWRPFLLHRDMPGEGVPLRDFLKAKFGTDDSEKLRQGSEPLRQAGAAVGITWNKERKMVNTLKSHCVVELAHRQDKGHSLVGEIFSAYFERGEDINDTGVLCKLAEKVGVEGAKQCLEAGTYSQSVLIDYDSAFKSGITKVPHFTIRVGGAEPARFAGAQSPELFAHILRQLLNCAEVPAGTQVRIDGKAEGEVVGFEGSAGNHGHFAVKPTGLTSSGDDKAGFIYTPREKLEVLQVTPLGSTVELEGLSDPGLNGRQGEVVRYHADKCRFEVRLQGEERSKAIRAKNLRVVHVFFPGDGVVLDGLKAAHLNGQEAEVLGYLPDKERFEVRTRRDGQVKAIQGEKLHAVSN